MSSIRRTFSILAVFLLVVFCSSIFFQAEAKRRCKVKGKPAPDLVIITEGTSIKWSGKCNAVSPKLIGSVTIKNVGQAPTPKVDSSIVSIWDINNEKCKIEGASSVVLNPGEKLVTDIKACRFIAGQVLDGKRKIKIQIDRYQKISECNERNNSWPGVIEVELSCTAKKQDEKAKKNKHSSSKKAGHKG